MTDIPPQQKQKAKIKTNLRKLMNNKKFEVFKSDPSHYPGYTMIVQEPMYLQKILQNVENLQKVKADLELLRLHRPTFKMLMDFNF